MMRTFGVDTETGAFVPSAGPLLEIGCFAEVDTAVERLQVLVLPEPGWGSVSPAAAKVNGYPDRWEGAVPLARAMRQLREWIGDLGERPAPVAYNAGFDRAFIDEAVERTGIRLPIDHHWRCPMSAAAQCVEQVVHQRPRLSTWADGFSLSLAHVAEVLEIGQAAAHEAEDDARVAFYAWQTAVTGEMFERIHEDALRFVGEVADAQ